jgi:predicted metal-dependent enzyme (double-stranded beta helix superfamily)
MNQIGADTFNEFGRREMSMFEVARFIDECRAAVKEADALGAVRELVARVVSEPTQVLRALGEPERSGVQTVYKAHDLTILNVCWGPLMEFHPHDHRMWAVIGIYGGCEQNTFYRRNKVGLTKHGSKVLNAKNAIALGDAVIHAVANPLDQITGAIHIYGGDFFGRPRSEWDPKTLEERPYDVEHTMREFEAANERLRAKVARSQSVSPKTLNL